MGADVEHVSRQQGNVSLDGSATDPESGTKITAGLEVKWGLEKSGSMISEFSLGSEAVLVGFGELLTRQYDWLQKAAASQGMSRNGGGISQGFGVVTSVLWANSGLNVAAQSDNTTFSVTGSVSGVNELVGQAEGKGSYSSATANKSVDKHMWPDQATKLADTAVPIAYTFASFDGRLLIPNWTMEVGSFQLVLNNQHGGTYIVKANLSYDTPQGKRSEEASVSGGLIATPGRDPARRDEPLARAGVQGRVQRRAQVVQVEHAARHLVRRHAAHRSDRRLARADGSGRRRGLAAPLGARKRRRLGASRGPRAGGNPDRRQPWRSSRAGLPCRRAWSTR